MEGPSLAILRDELEQFRGQKVLRVRGNTKQPKELIKHHTLRHIDTWGKQLFLTFSSPSPSQPSIVSRTQFLMFGSYRVNNPKLDQSPRLELKFQNGVVNFYACSIKFGADTYLQDLDPRVDLMSDRWEEGHVVASWAGREILFFVISFGKRPVQAGLIHQIKMS